MSVAATAKAHLVGVNGVLAPLLTGVQVTYSEPRDIKRDIVYAGDVAGPVTLAAMAGGGTVKRTEALSFPLIVRVWRPNAKSAETADARADAIGDVIANYIAANWTFGGLAELKKAIVSNIQLSSWIDDEGAGSLLIMTVELTSFRN